MLIYFILGILLISVILPITNFFQSFLQIFIEYITYTYAYKIYKIKEKMKENDQEEEDKNPIGFHTEAIGFSVPDIEQEEQY